MNLTVIGINFKTAPIELRESFSLSPSRISHVIIQLRKSLPHDEVLLLSTCNRTELYVATPDLEMDKPTLLQHLADSTNASLKPEDASFFYEKKNHEALKHLLAVSSSLDSMVVGEAEILGQVKQAYVLATEAQDDCKILHKFCHGAFRAAKRVFAETDIAQGRVSVSSVAVDFAKKVFENLSAKNVMIIGAGETAELTLKSLLDKGVREVFVLNRSIDKAESIAREHGGKAIPFERMDNSLCYTDIVISCTGAPHCVVKTRAVRRAVAARHNRPILLIDIAMPRDIEEDAGKLDNVYLYDIDDLQQVAQENLGKRQEAVDQAWEIIKEETQDLSLLLHAVSFSDTMKQLSQYAENIESSEIERTLAKEVLANLPEAGQDEIRTTIRRIVRRVLGPSRRALNQARKNGQWEQVSGIISEIFSEEHTEDSDRGDI